MKNHQIDFHSFISNTFKEKYFGNKDENRILLFQDWNGDVHENASFYEIIKLENSQWKLRHSNWEMGKDTFRLQNIIENLKWTGKEIIASVKIRKFDLSDNEKELLQKKINNIQIKWKSEFSMMNYKLLKLENKEKEISFYWNESDKIEDSIFELVKEIKKKT